MTRIAPLALFLLAASLPAQMAPDPRPYTALYVFGDSYSDTGAGFQFADGPTAVAYLAQYLHIPFTYYGAPDAQGKSLNFAVSAAKTGADPGIHEAPNAVFRVGMKNQVDEFAALLHSGDLKFDPAQTMFYFAGGLNDRGSASGYTRTNIEAEIDTLYSLGARRFMVALLPTKIPAFTSAGYQFNLEIRRIPADARAQHPEIRIALSDWGPFFDEVVANPAKYGLTNTTSPCAAGLPLHHQSPAVCASPSTHFYYYEAHPSTAAHRAVGSMLYTEALTQAP
jgi:phospholipase/lecithinase/hemolysin